MENTHNVLSPMKFSGSIYGDWGYEINGVKSEKSYVSKAGAYKAMCRALDKIEFDPKKVKFNMAQGNYLLSLLSDQVEIPVKKRQAVIYTVERFCQRVIDEAKKQ